MIAPLELHAEYASVGDALTALDSHLLQRGKTRRKIGTNSHYRRFVCDGVDRGCPFVCAFNKSRHDGLWRVVQLEGVDHPGCMGSFRPGFRQVLEPTRQLVMAHNDAVAAADVRAHLAQQYGVQVSKGSVYRALEAVAAEKQGFAESVGLLPALVERFRAADPEGTYALTQRPEDLAFRGVFIMPSGFARLASTCKPVLAVDCAHLRNSWHSGRLMFVIPQDAERHNVVVAFSILDGENWENYVWAFEQMKANAILAELLADEDLTIVSDRSKGLASAVEHAFPRAAHFNCARHIVENVHRHVHSAGQHFDKRKHGSLVWKAQAAESVDKFEAALAALGDVCPLAADYLRDIDASTWAVHAFPRSLFAIRTNNMVEHMNSAVLKERALESLVDMIKGILLKVLNKIDDHSIAARRFEGTCCPAASKLIQEQQELAARYTSVKTRAWPGFYEAHVRFAGASGSQSTASRPDERTVTIKDGKIECTCRFPHSTKLPCRHVIAVAASRSARLHGVVADDVLQVPRVYTVANYIRGYQGAGAVVPQTDDLPSCSSIRVPTVPPPASTKRLKPKHELAEEQALKKRRPVTCGVCGRTGHSRRACGRVSKTEQAAASRHAAPAEAASAEPVTTGSDLRPDQVTRLEVLRQSTVMLHALRRWFVDPQLMAQLRS